MAYHHTIHIEAPVEKVFDFFKDPRNWQGLEREGVVLKDVRVTEEGLGTNYGWVARIAGVRFEGFNEFTEFISNKRIVDASSRGFEGTWTYDFEPDVSGTKMTIENRSGGLWALPPLGLLMDYMAKGHEQVYEAMKARIEA